MECLFQGQTTDKCDTLMKSGYIKLNRKLFESKMWKAIRPFSEFEAWIDLLQSARYEDTPITKEINGLHITWNKGQYAASIRFLSIKWHRTERWVRTFLSGLKRYNMIKTECDQGVTIITICDGKNRLFDTANDTAFDTANPKKTNVLYADVTQRMTHPPEKRHSSDTNNKKDEIELSDDNSCLCTTPCAREVADEKYSRFKEWLSVNCPYIATHLTPMSVEEFYKLRDKYGSTAISEVCENIENRVDLRKRYKNLYRTMLNWLKNYAEKQKPATNYTTSNKISDSLRAKLPAEPACGLIE